MASPGPSPSALLDEAMWTRIWLSSGIALGGGVVGGAIRSWRAQLPHLQVEAARAKVPVGERAAWVYRRLARPLIQASVTHGLSMGCGVAAFTGMGWALRQCVPYMEHPATAHAVAGAVIGSTWGGIKAGRLGAGFGGGLCCMMGLSYGLLENAVTALHPTLLAPPVPTPVVEPLPLDLDAYNDVDCSKGSEPRE